MDCEVDFTLQGAISVIETDCEVDFAPPLDYVEPRRQPAEEPMDTEGEAGPSQAPEEPEEPQFKPFVGSGTPRAALQKP